MLRRAFARTQRNTCRQHATSSSVEQRVPPPSGSCAPMSEYRITAPRETASRRCRQAAPVGHGETRRGYETTTSTPTCGRERASEYGTDGDAAAPPSSESLLRRAFSRRRVRFALATTSGFSLKASPARTRAPSSATLLVGGSHLLPPSLFVILSPSLCHSYFFAFSFSLSLFVSLSSSSVASSSSSSSRFPPAFLHSAYLHCQPAARAQLSAKR